jgi:Predicted periplasmic solute-binding protein
VPYLNAKPIIDWFHSPECDADTEVIYAVPSQLATDLREGRLDVALVSTVELFHGPGLRVVPDISISADGKVRSVRLFSKVPIDSIRTVALDLGSLTSVALLRIILAETYGIEPVLHRHEPDLRLMLAGHDAGLIIGRLDDYQPRPPYVLDLGEAWKKLTGLPFCYAAWLARADVPIEPMRSDLLRAKEWGAVHRGELVKQWSERLQLPPERVAEYLCNTINYDLGPLEREAIDLFQVKCDRHGLIEKPVPVHYLES